MSGRRLYVTTPYRYCLHLTRVYHMSDAKSIADLRPEWSPNLDAQKLQSLDYPMRCRESTPAKGLKISHLVGFNIRGEWEGGVGAKLFSYS